MSIDHRLKERRKTVAEDNAKKSVSRLLKFLGFIVVVGSILWLAFSPWLSVSQVTATGIQTSDSHSVLADHGVVAGTPMLLIGAADVEESLMEDPWVSEATVRLNWPDEVTVDVTERRPTAWVQTASGWTRRAVDGVALPSGPEPDAEMARIDMGGIGDEEATESVELLGALEFVESLPVEHHPGTILTLVDGELWATVEGYRVRLGRADDMTEKALSLDALLGRNIPKGSTVTLIAPTNPSFSSPDEDDEEGDSAENSDDDGGEGDDEATSDENG